MTDIWELYHQTGVDGPEYGIRIRPGYVVVGFQKEDAEEIIGLRDEVERLQDLIDSPPEEADWLHDDARLCGEITTGVVQIARKWHSAYRKAQNSNLMRAKEIERLRSAPKSGLYGKYIIQKADGSPVDPHADYFVLRLDTDPIARRAALEYSYYLAVGKEDIQLAKDLQARVARYDPKTADAVYLRYVGVLKNEVVEMLEAKAVRIKELEAVLADMIRRAERLLATVTEDEAYRDRLGAAFLRSNSAMRYYQDGNRGPWPQVGEKFKEPYQKKARKELEKIRSGEKDESHS